MNPNPLIMFACLVPFILLALRSARVNLAKPERPKQLFMPVVALIYIVPLMLLMESVKDGIFNLIELIPAVLVSIAQSVPMISGPCLNLAASVAGWLNSLNWQIWLAFIAIVAILLIYIEIKRGILALMKKLFGNGSEITESISSVFYEFDNERGVWCLKDEYVDMRRLFKVLYYVGIGVSCGIMTASCFAVESGDLPDVYYPVYAVILLGELFFFMDGFTKEEYVTEVLGENENASKITNYSKLRKYLRTLFGDKLLTESTSTNAGNMHETSTDEVIKKMEISEDPVIGNMALFYRRLYESGFNIDNEYLYSSVKLVNGKSILFNNPFYRDLIPYAFYPMNRTLLSHKKVLVVSGRHGIDNEIKQWITDGIASVTNIPYLWDIAVLDNEPATADIGILSRSSVLDKEVIDANEKFLQDVEFVVILEPSKLISTAQIGLNIIVRKCREDNPEKELTYCICDRNCDGLVDAMSHILMTSLEEVAATEKHSGTVSYMCWDVDDEYLHHRMLPNVSRYLGGGTEFSFAALKNQVSSTDWFGGESFPVSDISWISRQYYHDLMSYAGLPADQKLMEECFNCSVDFWGAEKRTNYYMSVEDEFFNMFEILREFSTRSETQGFVNIISPDYLLKDYMADNAQIFMADPKAIPHIVPDFARTERNVALKLALRMSEAPLKEIAIVKELSLIGIKNCEIRNQLWLEIYKCFVRSDEVMALPGDYIDAVAAADALTLEHDGKTFGIEVISVDTAYDYCYEREDVLYSIENQDFIDAFLSNLKSVSYVAEDEEEDTNYVGTELTGQIFQKYLPGQFLTLAGKYYEMRGLTAGGEILVRRASDHIEKRLSYRQIRNYTLTHERCSEMIGDTVDISGLRIFKEFCDIEVETPGYYKMSKYGDFKTADKVSYQVGKIPNRVYKNKHILKVELPEKAGISDEVRYTITVLFNEVFRTLFAENQSYIQALTDISFMGENVREYPLTSLLVNGNAEEAVSGDRCIYIVEDSQLDLGLLEAVERNLNRIFEIVQDYLDWHFITLAKSLEAEEAPEKIAEFDPFVPDAGSRVENLVQKIKDFLRRKGREESDYPDDETTQDGSDIEKIMTRPPYSTRYYALFGFEAELDGLDLANSLNYLNACGFNNNPLSNARGRKNIASWIAENYRPNRKDIHYCDFCGCEISGVEYDILSDGRERCVNCGRSAIKTEDEFKALYEDVKRNLEGLFSIRINAGIRVEMMDSRRLHKKLRKSFVPSKGYDPRCIGVAIRDREGFKLYIENGSPRLTAALTIAHELTHIWQYVNWDDDAIRRKYGKTLELEIYEGMAKWVEIQYAYLINEMAYGKREELNTLFRNDEYGYGFIRYACNYPLTYDSVLDGKTPFMNKEQPLAFDFCGPIRGEDREGLVSELLDPVPDEADAVENDGLDGVEGSDLIPEADRLPADGDFEAGFDDEAVEESEPSDDDGALEEPTEAMPEEETTEEAVPEEEASEKETYEEETPEEETPEEAVTEEETPEETEDEI